MNRITLCRVLLAAAIVVGLPSLWETVLFSWDPPFAAPALRYGPTHTNYHAFREFTFAVGALGVMVWGMAQPINRRTAGLWIAMALACGFYYGGWWAPWPLLGLNTPSLVAELNHEAAPALAVAAMAIAWRPFHAVAVRSDDSPAPIAARHSTPGSD